MTYRSPKIAQMLPLESRRLFAAVYPSNYEQYLVELINRGRANPAAEASRYGIDLNEGLAAGTPSEPTRALESSAGAPNTIHFMNGRVPPEWFTR